MSCNSERIDCYTIGDDLRVWVPVIDSKGQTVDISQAQEIEFRIFRNYGQPPVVSKSLGNGILVSGNLYEFYFDIESADTQGLQPGQYKMEAWVVTGSGLIYTGLRGTIRMQPSKRVSE